MSDIQKYGEEFQRVSKDGFDASVRSLGEWNKGFQAIAATVADYSKKAFEDGTRAFEQLVGVKSVEQAWEIHLSTRRRRSMPTLHMRQSSARCMSTWRAMPTGLWSKPLPKPPGRSPNALQFRQEARGPGPDLFNFPSKRYDTPRITT